MMETSHPPPHNPWPEGGSADSSSTQQQQYDSSRGTLVLQAAAAAIDYAATYNTTASHTDHTVLQSYLPNNSADAKARCSVEGCDKQAQTTHMCKRHWKLKNFAASPEIQSVYETVLPQSIAFRPMAAAKAQENNKKNAGRSMDPLDPDPGE